MSVNIPQALLGAAFSTLLGVVTESVARRAGFSWAGVRAAASGAIIGAVLFGTAVWAGILGWARGSAGSLAAAVVLLAIVAIAAGPMKKLLARRRAAREALRLLTSEVRADRERGYQRVSKALGEGEQLPAAIEHELRRLAVDDGADYGDRERAVRLLRQAGRLDGLRGELAILWFRDAHLPEHFSGALSACFADRRADLLPLLDVLERIEPPDSDERRNDGVATAGYRLSQGFGSVRDALRHDGAPLDEETRTRLLQLTKRFAPVPQLSPLLGEIERELR